MDVLAACLQALYRKWQINKVLRSAESQQRKFDRKWQTNEVLRQAGNRKMGQVTGIKKPALGGFFYEGQISLFDSSVL